MHTVPNVCTNMEKESKSCMGVLLRAELTGHGQFSQFPPKRGGWLCPVRSALNKTPVQDFNSFSIMFYYIFNTTYQKIGDLFCPYIFLDFRTVCLGYSTTKTFCLRINISINKQGRNSFFQLENFISNNRNHQECKLELQIIY